MITAEEVLMGRDKQWPLTEEMSDNLDALLVALNMFRQAYGKPMIVSSGYRPYVFNATVKGAAPNSAHTVCLACDFVDKDGKLDLFCLDNLALLRKCGLYLESPANTPGWTHLQLREPKSGNRVFLP